MAFKCFQGVQNETSGTERVKEKNNNNSVTSQSLSFSIFVIAQTYMYNTKYKVHNNKSPLPRLETQHWKKCCETFFFQQN